ncbi:MAG: signal peptidase I [Candidatus Lokiarchaeota archaeon]|nr:signal peptidase I [Candidatus Lokiarchaeota archaeon]
MKVKNLKTNSKKDKEPISKKKVIIAVILIGFSFFGSFLIYFILQLSLNTETPMVVVISGSMEPNIHKGDLLFLQGQDAEDIKEGSRTDQDGDIIVFDAHGLWAGAPDEPIVHRVVGKYKEDGKWYFITRGDANDYDDEEPIPENRILGVVVGRIPYVGWVKIILTDYGLFIPLMIILSVPLILSIIWDIIKDQEKEKVQEKDDSKELSTNNKLMNERKESEIILNKEDEFDF